MLWLGLAILLTCILIGARVGGIGLGAVSGLGVVNLAAAIAELRSLLAARRTNRQLVSLGQTPAIEE